MKIAIAGGGSTYTPELAGGLAARAEALGLEELALFDVDPQRLEVVGGFVERLVHRTAPALRVTRTLALDAALWGARLVVAQIRVGGQAARREDERLGLEHGLVGQETTGVGGLAKALRTVPALLHLAKRMEAVAPDAWLVNFTNPVSITTEALLGWSKIRTIGLCNIPIGQRRELAAQLGVSPEDVVVDSVGLNHLSFIRGVEVRGREVLPQLISDVSKLLRSGSKPANIPDLDFPPELLEQLGMIPSDYLRYFYLTDDTIQEQRARGRTRAEEVMELERELLAYYASERNTDKPAALSKRGGAFYSHAALEIIEAILLDHPSRLVVDVRNGSTLFELPPGACVEVPCLVAAEGPRPLPQRPLPPVIRGLIQHVKAYEELAIRAALSGERRDVYQALLAHPLVANAGLAGKLADRLMARG